MDDARADDLLDSTLSKINNAAGDIAALVADGDDSYMLKIAMAVEDDLLSSAQRALLVDSSPLIGREAALGVLVGKFNRLLGANVALAGLVGDVQAGKGRVHPDNLMRAATDFAAEAARVRDQALVLLAPPASMGEAA